MKTSVFNKIFSEIFNSKTEFSRKKELIDELVNEDPNLLNKNSGHDKFKYANIIFNSILKEPELFNYIKEKNYYIDYSAVSGRDYQYTLLEAIYFGNRDELFTNDNIDNILKNLKDPIRSDFYIKDLDFDIVKVMESPYFKKEIMNIDLGKNELGNYSYNYFLESLFQYGHPQIDLIFSKIEMTEEYIQDFNHSLFENILHNSFPEETINVLKKYNCDLQKTYDSIENKISFLEDLSFDKGEFLKNKGINLYLDADTEEKILDNITDWVHLKESINLYKNNLNSSHLNKNYKDIKTQDIFFLHIYSKKINRNMSFSYFQWKNDLEDINSFFKECSPFSIKSPDHTTYDYKLNLNSLQHKHIFSYLNGFFVQAYIDFPEERENIDILSSQTILNYIEHKGKNNFTEEDIYLIKNDHRFRYSLKDISLEDNMFKKIENIEELLIKNNYLINFNVYEHYKNNTIDEFFNEKKDSLSKYFSEDYALKMTFFFSTFLNHNFTEARNDFNQFCIQLDLLKDNFEKLLNKDISLELDEAFSIFAKESHPSLSISKDKERICLNYSLYKSRHNEDNTIKNKKRL